MKHGMFIKSTLQKTVLCSAIALSTCQMVYATAALDSSFGTGGQVTTSIVTINKANGIAIDQNGKSVVVGSTTDTDGVIKFALVRYLTNGTLDTSFGTAGKVILSFAADPYAATAVAIQTDGKIVLSGTSKKNALVSTGVLVRLNTNGSLDTTFGTGGIATISSVGNMFPLSMVLDSQERIVVTGSYRNSLYVARYTSLGQPDTTFGTGVNGLIRIQQPDDADSVGRSVTVTPSGKIAVAGFTTLTDNSVSWLIVQVTSAGVLDSTFATNGQLKLPFIAGTNNNIANAITVKSDNSLYVGGRIAQSASGLPSVDMAVAHVLANGTLDPAFGTGGYTRVHVTPEVTASVITSLALDSAGYIVVGGSLAYNSVDYMVGRFTPAGALDTTFTSTGYLQTHLSVGSNAPTGLAIQSDGKIMLTGTAIDGSGNALFGTIRVTP